MVFTVSELWKSDGTETGTVMVKDIGPGSSGSSPSNLTNIDGTLFFTAGGGHGWELWKTDGTEAGTVVVTEIYASDWFNTPNNLTNVNGTWFFSANSAPYEGGLWTTGGDLGLSASDLAVKNFVFADGSVLTIDDIIARSSPTIIGQQYGTFGDDILQGSIADDRVSGFDGDDKISAFGGNDRVEGGAGNDVIGLGIGDDEGYGDAGNDVVAGGRGNDYLFADQGNDVYCFNRGDGQDYIDNWPGSSTGDVDTLSFGAGITPDDLTGYVDPSGALVLSISGSNDSMCNLGFIPSMVAQGMTGFRAPPAMML